MNFLEKIVNDREVRLRSPGFMAEMAREKAEFNDILKDLGNNTLDAGCSILWKAPVGLLGNALKTIYNKKYGINAYMKDSFKLFFDKNGVLHNVLKVTANAVAVTGKTVKIGIRQLLAI